MTNTVVQTGVFVSVGLQKTGNLKKWQQRSKTMRNTNTQGGQNTALSSEYKYKQPVDCAWVFKNWPRGCLYFGVLVFGIR